EGRQHLHHCRPLGLSDPVGGSQRKDQAFFMKFVEIKLLLGKRLCRQQGASHTRILIGLGPDRRQRRQQYDTPFSEPVAFPRPSYHRTLETAHGEWIIERMRV